MEALKLTDDQFKTDAYYKELGLHKESISIKLKPEEIVEAKLQRDALSEIIDDIKEEAKEVAKDFREQIKRNEKKKKPLTQAIRTGYMEKEIWVSTSPNDSTSEVEYYDENGEFITSRPMKPHERTPMKLYPHTLD